MDIIKRYGPPIFLVLILLIFFALTGVRQAAPTPARSGIPTAEESYARARAENISRCIRVQSDNKEKWYRMGDLCEQRYPLEPLINPTASPSR